MTYTPFETILRREPKTADEKVLCMAICRCSVLEEYRMLTPAEVYDQLVKQWDSIPRPGQEPRQTLSANGMFLTTAIALHAKSMLRFVDTTKLVCRCHPAQVIAIQNIGEHVVIDEHVAHLMTQPRTFLGIPLAVSTDIPDSEIQFYDDDGREILQIVQLGH